MSDGQGLAIAAAFREDLRRARQALEACAAAAGALQAIAEGNIKPPPAKGNTWPGGSPATMAAVTLLRLLEAGARIDKAIAEELGIALEAVRSRRAPTSARGGEA